jgi:actin beta/gamma 1
MCDPNRHHTFYNELRVAPEEYPLVVSHTSFTPQAHLEKTLQIAMETYNVPAFFSANQVRLDSLSISLLTPLFSSSFFVVNLLIISKC